MTIDAKANLDELRAAKKRWAEMRTLQIKQQTKAYAQLYECIVVCIGIDDTLREIDNLLGPDTSATEAVKLDPALRDAVLRVDGSAADFVLALIGLSVDGVGAASMLATAREMKTKHTTGSIHAALHRLHGAGQILKVTRKKGASYRLTRAGANAWSQCVRKAIESQA